MWGGFFPDFVVEWISERRESQDNIKVISTLFRFANMFPQHYVSYPLLNYIKGYKGDLYGVDVFSREFKESNFNKKNVKLNSETGAYGEYITVNALDYVSYYATTIDGELPTIEDVNVPQVPLLKGL